VKAFTERNPYYFGVFLVVLLLLMSGSAVLLNGGILKNRYTIHTLFADSAGITTSTKVRLAGIVVGEVTHIRQSGDKVEVDLGIDKGTKIPQGTRASIIVETLLGTKYVRLETPTSAASFQHLLGSGDTISDTSTPVQVLDVQNTGTKLLNDTDATSLNDLMAELSAATKGQNQNLQQILSGLNRLSSVVNQRETQARSLIDSAQTLSDALANHDQDLVGAIDNLNVVVANLVQRRAELSQLLSSTAAASKQLAQLIAKNRPGLDATLDELHQDLQILSRHQLDLAQSLSLLGAAIQGFSSIAYAGPDQVPVPWANIFAELLGPVDQDALYGRCGAVDTLLTAAFGPDVEIGSDGKPVLGPDGKPVQVPCEQSPQGPIAGLQSGQSAGGAVPAGSGLQTASVQPGGADGLALLLKPVLAP
jgi:phospholipid/cholesterol/gamma-HCH transport system substrate-binding protein